MEDSPEHIVMGAHYDSHHIAPGAADNASGVVTIVEAARALVQHREHIKRTIKVALFSGEEVGLVGAWAYTHQHYDELEDTILMLNNDGQGGDQTELASTPLMNSSPFWRRFPGISELRVRSFTLTRFR